MLSLEKYICVVDHCKNCIYNTIKSWLNCKENTMNFSVFKLVKFLFFICFAIYFTSAFLAFISFYVFCFCAGVLVMLFYRFSEEGELLLT